jgi:hypothetical protein
MKINLKLESDSDNSHNDTTQLEITPNDDYDEVYFKLSDEDREISVSKAELLKVLRMIE